MITKQRPYILEPKTQAFVDALSAQGIKPIHELSYGEARQVLEDVQAGAPTALRFGNQDELPQDARFSDTFLLATPGRSVLRTGT